MIIFVVVDGGGVIVDIVDDYDGFLLSRKYRNKTKQRLLLVQANFMMTSNSVSQFYDDKQLCKPIL